MTKNEPKNKVFSTVVRAEHFASALMAVSIRSQERAWFNISGRASYGDEIVAFCLLITCPSNQETQVERALEYIRTRGWTVETSLATALTH